MGHNHRFYIIEDESLFSALQAHDASVEEMYNKRKAFFEEWGSLEYLQGRNASILGMKDPRTFDPPQKPPKGWKKLSKFPDYVQPTNTETGRENWKMLKIYNFPIESTVTAELVNRIMALDEFNFKRMSEKSMQLFSAKHPVSYFAEFEDGLYNVHVSIVSFRHINQWCLIITDDMLKIDAIPGCREIKQWEYEKAICELNEWEDNRKK